MNTIRIEMVSTGDEVLYGQIIDTNACWLADYLFQQGFLMTSRFTVGDDLAQLIDTLQKRSAENDILIVNGGLGPTSDDLSALAAAKANNEELVLHQAWLDVMEQYFTSRGKTMAPANIKQAMLPKSATIVDNPVGTACGFKMVINHCVIYFTPGVPSEFKEMVKSQIVPEIQQRYPSVVKPLCYRLTTMGRSESDLATEIDSKLAIPSRISVGYRSAMPIIELKLTGDQSLQSEMDIWWAQLKEIVKDNLLYEGTIGLAAIVSELAKQQAQQLIILEQQTAGLMAYQLYDHDAPVIKSEVLSPAINISELTNQLINCYPDALILFLGEFEDEIFNLRLSNAKQTVCYQLKYTSRRHAKQTEQAIFSAIGLDALRRYFNHLPLVGPNIWLDVLSENIIHH